MIRAAALLAALLGLAGCMPTQTGFSQGASEIAGQRMGFVAEAVCLNNQTRQAQDRAARALSFPVVERDGAATIYVNPGTLTFMRIGPVPAQGVTIEDGSRIEVPAGIGCSVGSPAVGQVQANRLAGEILAPRLVDGSDTLRAPLGAGVNAAGGAGFFFEGLTVTLPLARTTFTDPETGEATGFDHPVILIVHN
ncbi:hypothetical protein [Jannaschia ovalis]|uniref:Lipoprotein n=1 Tax=Jannaschia ovalis TaxID=3038773 RepID=A0ABY8LFL0_9RHOB|nr:hypothetical protein [Jannaschia sp. GRR-S6-38]WGH80089.1 hypothetical protein P8627_07445 [Jannaschia sp. GRR-S6-38]